ncbi:hypothetical protein LOTGIDRAFT_174747 [Lottia gigantea]|uniref:Uncharacterized protein n=1 Tax=Lottia gigantea TaxID=225164 RepID=V4APF1_LOTGI|nr:hypothetical protein LOTGIDRAFT_174747 [Lottia gigantea]ESO96670.1 hypothetical protein LOTGIDRAFT_174747 [Lottia gigantea]
MSSKEESYDDQQRLAHQQNTPTQDYLAFLTAFTRKTFVNLSKEITAFREVWAAQNDLHAKRYYRGHTTVQRAYRNKDTVHCLLNALNVPGVSTPQDSSGIPSTSGAFAAPSSTAPLSGTEASVSISRAPSSCSSISCRVQQIRQRTYAASTIMASCFRKADTSSRRLPPI